MESFNSFSPSLSLNLGGATTPLYLSVVAEIGTSHMGDLSLAKQTIDAVADAGAQAIKLQIFYADEILAKNTPAFMLEGKEVDLFGRFQSLERGKEFYSKLSAHAKRRGIPLLASFFGRRSFSLARALKLAAYKIASPESHYTELWERVANDTKPIFCSLGMTTIKDLDWLTLEIEKRNLQRRVCFMHCLSRYPAREEEYNLRCMLRVMRRTKMLCGLSDHSEDAFFLPTLAASYLMWEHGRAMWKNKTSAETKKESQLKPYERPSAFQACGNPYHFVLEKHVSLANGHLDDAVAISVEELKELMRFLRRSILSSRIEVSEAINGGEMWTETQWKKNFCEHFCYDEMRVDLALGNGVFGLAQSEEEYYRTTNRSLLATQPIARGEIVDLKNTGFLRSESGKKPGADYTVYHAILEGKQFLARRAIKEGAPVTLSNLK